jgi:hypothetical protein
VLSWERRDAVIRRRAVWCVEHILVGEREMWGEGTGGCEVTCGCLVCGTDIGGREGCGGRDWWM